MKAGEAPETLEVELEQLHEELVRATEAGGETGEAARKVLKTLFPHMVLERAFAMPPLKLLAGLARGEFRPEMKKILRRTDGLQAELPRMLEQHAQIVVAVRKLLQAAQREGHAGYAGLAQRVIHHAQKEEEILYPAAILVGEYIKLRLGRK